MRVKTISVTRRKTTTKRRKGNRKALEEVPFKGYDMPEKKKSVQERRSDVVGTEQSVRSRLRQFMPPEQVSALMNQLNVLKIKQVAIFLDDIVNRLQGMKNVSAVFMLKYINDYLAKKDKLGELNEINKTEKKKIDIE
jgi:hypothetical protein